MKILQINNFHYLRGGADRVYLETSKLLAEKGHDVFHFSMKDDVAISCANTPFFVEPQDFFQGSYFQKIKSVKRFIYSKEARDKLARIIREKNPDLAHLHIFYGRLTSSILPILKKYKIPTVMTIHDYKLLCPAYTLLNNSNAICENCASGNYFHCILKRCNRGNLSYSVIAALEAFARDYFFSYENHIDKFIMVSDFIRKKHTEYKPLLKKKAITIYNFTEEFANNKIPENHGYYLSLGRLSREKGITTLLEAWKTFPHLKLKIAGEGNYRPQISQFIRKNNLGNVELLGFLNGNDLVREIRGAKFIVVPSEWFEAFGLNIIEGFAQGKPAIGARIGGITELIKENYNGFLFESKNVESLIAAIQTAENVPQSDYEQMGRNAVKLIQKRFNKEIHYKNLLEVYHEVVNGSK